MNPQEQFYLQQTAPISQCLLALKNIILAQDENVVATWKYGMPVFTYKGKMFCYLWVHKKHLQPYLGIVEGKHITHPKLIIEKRARMKIMLFDSNEDLPIEAIENILQQAIQLYKTGIVKTKTA
ncbi:MAG: DUF1801 domain-containing protein [Bacteroidota bacterium]